MSDWNPGLYERFAREREQPARDLLARVDCVDVKSIVDLGCGNGASTALLRERWPGVDILGIDSSPAMLEAARRAMPEGRFECVKIEAWNAPSPVDVLFANASLHWVPNHAVLLPRLLESVKPGGVLAFQMPNIHASPLHAAAARLLRDPSFDAQRSPEPAAPPGHENVYEYRAILERHASRIDIWETEYRHVLPDHAAILDWFRATGLRPYLDTLTDATARARLESALLTEIRRIYAERSGDGSGVVFPFRRFFVVATRA